MSQRLPFFSLKKKRSRGDWPSTLTFTYQKFRNLVWIVAFRPLDEQFDVYVGWARDNHNPFENVVQIPDSKLLDNGKASALMLPTAAYANRGGATYWSFWNPPDDLVDDPAGFGVAFAHYYSAKLSEPEARALVRDSVKEAIQEIECSCIPFLQQLSPQPA